MIMNKWIINETETLLSTPIGKFCSTNKIDPSGTERKYISMNAPDWVCAIVQFDDKPNEFLMVKLFRHGINQEIVEFPSGMVDDGESALQALRRELKEELGIDRENIVSLTELYSACPNPAFMNNKMTCYFAVINGYGANNPDEDEFLESEIVSAEKMASIVSADNYNVMMRFAWERAIYLGLIKQL